MAHTLDIKYTESGTVAGNAISYEVSDTISIDKVVHFRYKPFKTTTAHSDYIYRKGGGASGGLFDSDGSALKYARFTNCASSGLGTSYDITIEMTNSESDSTEDTPWIFKLKGGESLVLSKWINSQGIGYKGLDDSPTLATLENENIESNLSNINTIKCVEIGSSGPHLEVLLAMSGF
ncbi:MAG: hypothetical protein Unbinned4234contig1003_18 [Prokaryotic dsDNA virus sp.]|nr:MAG: hypothetical protein Unbinned4234contig1003_18 [Prokaryotic dsDNA virus sp.]|tara:strand:- start:3468 stop:4001 length:534 start_codon:yes stop_codon:yes gene_type:complete